MSEESTTRDLVELTRGMLDAAASRNFEVFISTYAPDAVWDGSATGVGIFEGTPAIRRFMEDWIGAFEDYGHTYEDRRYLGNGVLFLALRLEGRPLGGAGRLQERYAVTVVWAVGMIVRVIVATAKEIDEARAVAERLAAERG